MAQWADSRTNKRTNEQMSLPSYIPPDTLSRAYIARVEQEERRRKRARAILEIGSHFHDSVPEAILVPKPPGSTKTLPNGSRYGTSEKEVQDVLELLEEKGYVERDRLDKKFRLSHKVYCGMHDRMSMKDRLIAWREAMWLLHEAFPRRDTHTGQLFHVWGQCEPLYEHVFNLSLGLEGDWLHRDVVALQASCELFDACRQYMLETGHFHKLKFMLKVHKRMIMGKLEPSRETMEIDLSFKAHAGQLAIRGALPVQMEFGTFSQLAKLDTYAIRIHDGGGDGDGDDDDKRDRVQYFVQPSDRTRKIEVGLESLEDVVCKRFCQKPLDAQKLAWAADDLCTALLTKNHLFEADVQDHSARHSSLVWSRAQDKLADRWWLAAVNCCFTRGLLIGGEVKKARDLLEEALKHLKADDPGSWATIANAYFNLGTINRHLREFGDAEHHFTIAQSEWQRGCRKVNHPFNIACVHKLGSLALDLGRVEDAVNYLRKAVALCNTFSHGEHRLEAERMRSIFMLSEALKRDLAGAREAQRLRTQAEDMLRKFDPNHEDPGLEATYDKLIFIEWR